MKILLNINLKQLYGNLFFLCCLPRVRPFYRTQVSFIINDRRHLQMCFWKKVSLYCPIIITFLPIDENCLLIVLFLFIRKNLQVNLRITDFINPLVLFMLPTTQSSRHSLNHCNTSTAFLHTIPICGGCREGQSHLKGSADEYEIQYNW